MPFLPSDWLKPLAFDWLFDSKVPLFELDRRRLKIFFWNFCLENGIFNPLKMTTTTIILTRYPKYSPTCYPFCYPNRDQKFSYHFQFQVFWKLTFSILLYKFLRNKNLNFRFSPRILERGWPRAWARVGWWSESFVARDNRARVSWIRANSLQCYYLDRCQTDFFSF